MDKSFYNEANIDFKYPEIGICMESTEGPEVKISIPIATPTLPLDVPYDQKELLPSTRNILSDTSTMNIEQCTESNYITMKLPEDISSLSRGDKVVLGFIGGDINVPFISRRYIENE